MHRNKFIQSLAGLSILSVISCWKIFYQGESVVGEFVTDFLVVITLLGFGEILFYTLALGAAQIISNAIQPEKSN